MAGKSSKGAAKAPIQKADQAAPAAAPAAAEQLANQPAATTDNAAPIPTPPPGSTEQPGSDAPGLEAGNQGQDAPTVLVVGDMSVGAYIEALKAHDVNVIQLGDLAEHTLRHVAKFVEIEGYDVLPPEQLVSMIEAEVGIEPAPGSGLEAPAVLQAGGDTSDAVDDLAAYLDGEIEGLWIVAIPEQGFRRCGFRFTREGLAIALSALTEQQIEQLENEPNLKVERGIFSGRVGERVN